MVFVYLDDVSVLGGFGNTVCPITPPVGDIEGELCCPGKSYYLGA